MNIPDLIKNDTRRLLTELNKPNLVKILKFYEIVLDMLYTKTKKNKREIFYQSVNVFKNQSTIDRLIMRCIKNFHICQSDLLITTSLKGLFNGDIIFRYKKRNLIVHSLIPDMNLVDEVITETKKILVVEKDSLFSLICSICRPNKKFDKVLFVCGKGYPCNNTVKLLQYFKNQQVYGLFDYDPFGLHIYSVYKYGTKTNTLKCKNMKRIGMNSNDLFDYKIDENELISLNKYDNKLIEKLLNEENDLKDDLLFLKGMEKKMEMEIFTGGKSDFISNYLINKLEL